MKRILITAVALSTLTPAAFAANNIDQIQLLIQTQFKDLSKDLSAALSYKAVTPPAPLGLTGFDVGVEVTSTEIINKKAWDLASSGSGPSNLIIPKLHVYKGLPLGFDIGAFYSSVPTTNITFYGGELRYAILEGGMASPAVGVRGNFTKLSGISKLDFSTYGVDVSASKGFAMFTPYAGAGYVWATSTPDASTLLKEEKPNDFKVFLGANLNLGLINLALEYDKTGKNNSYSAKVGWRF